MQNKNNAQKSAQKQNEKNVQNANVQVTNSAQIKLVASKMKTGAGYIERMRVIGVFGASPSKVTKNGIETARSFVLYGAAIDKLLAANIISTKTIVDALIIRQRKACRGKDPRKFSEYFVHEYLQRIIKQNATFTECRNYLVAERAEMQQLANETK